MIKHTCVSVTETVRILITVPVKEIEISNDKATVSLRGTIGKGETSIEIQGKHKGVKLTVSC